MGSNAFGPVTSELGWCNHQGPYYCSEREIVWFGEQAVVCAFEDIFTGNSLVQLLQTHPA